MADRPVRLAVVGASARAAAFSALRAGFEVVTADLFADEDLRRRCPATRIEDYPNSLANWLADQEVDAWMYTGALENHPELVDRMATIRPLWGNSGGPLRRCRDPLALWQDCQERGVRFPDTAAEPRGVPLEGSWLGKTRRSSNGSGVWRLTGRAALDRALAEQAVYQAIVPGTPAAAVYLLAGGEGQLLGVTRQLVGDPRFGAAPWAYCGSVRLESPPSAAQQDELNKIGELLAAGLNLRGIVAVDLMLDADRVWLIEVNPRYSASVEVVESLAAAPLLIGHASCFAGAPKTSGAEGRRLPPAKAVLYAKQDAVVTQGFADGAWDLAGAGRLADLPAPGTVLARGNPVLTLFDAGPAAGATDRLASFAAEVESRLYHG